MRLYRRLQMAFYDIDLTEQVKNNHELWDIEEVVKFSTLVYRLKDLEKGLGRKGYGCEVGLRCLYLQFHYDLSDRELEKRLRFDMAMKWFCDFTAFEETPDHTYFSRFRTLAGTKRIGKIFNAIVKKAEKEGIIRNVFTFVDATAIKTKETTWKERDDAIKVGEKKVNNKNIKKYSADQDARYGCKGKDKFWFGYKETDSVDMGSGLKKKVAVTQANVPDQDAFKHVCPNGGMVFADKSYCLKSAQDEMKKKGCHSGAILKQNMTKKNKDLDRWISSVRAPFEGVFSKKSKRARYRGLAKQQLQAFLDAIVFNVKRLVVIHSQLVPLNT